MRIKKRDQIRALLKSIETGETDAVAVVNEDEYVQHNPHTPEGSEGLAVLFQRLSKTSPRVEIVRAFEDGDFVFAHTEYDFADENIGFEVFRFENGQAVEHWDNLQPRMGPNSSGHTMTDGPTEATDLDRTEANRHTVRAFVDDVLVHRRLERLGKYVDQQNYTEHDPNMADGFDQLLATLSGTATEMPTTSYNTIHRVLAEGNFVLSVCEGTLDETHCSFYDLYRIDNERLVEHWNTVDAIPPRNEWNNDNGKF
jgi:predicted SnoaL-like aldol condensation-catalyzing enzyme